MFRRPVWSVTPEELGALLRRSGIPCMVRLCGRTPWTPGRRTIPDAPWPSAPRQGLSREVLDLCDKTVLIPMSPRCESLNAAIAAAVLLWESWR